METHRPKRMAPAKHTQDPLRGAGGGQASMEAGAVRREGVHLPHHPNGGGAAEKLKSACLQSLALALESCVDGSRGSGLLETPVPGLSIVYSESEASLRYSNHKSAAWITIQGTTSALVGQARCHACAGEAFLLGAGLHSNCIVRAAGPAQPFLGLVMEVNPVCARELAEELGSGPPARRKALRASALELAAPVLQSVLRAVLLLETPEAVPMLYPGVMREICYWLLTGPGEAQLAQMAADNRDKRVTRALKHLHDNLNNPICIEQLANTVGMSPASLHRHFKCATRMSPHQYLKHLRLSEARRLIIAGDLNVKSVAFKVGYVSASHFSREYTRIFGRPPRQDSLLRDSA